MRGIVVLVVLGCVVLGVGACASYPSFSVGDCVQQRPGNTETGVKQVDCGAPDALYRVQSVRSSKRCDSRDYLARRVRTGSSSYQYLCLYLDLNAGDCIQPMNNGAYDPARTPCGPGAVRITKRVNGIADRAQCPASSTPPKLYTAAPRLTLCQRTL